LRKLIREKREEKSIVESVRKEKCPALHAGPIKKKRGPRLALHTKKDEKEKSRKRDSAASVEKGEKLIVGKRVEHFSRQKEMLQKDQTDTVPKEPKNLLRRGRRPHARQSFPRKGGVSSPHENGDTHYKKESPPRSRICREGRGGKKEGCCWK